MVKQPINTQKAREKQVAEEIWLHYFNNYLLEHGVITEREHRKMIVLIAGRKHASGTHRVVR